MFVWGFRCVRKNCEKWLLALSCLSVRPHGITQLPLDWFFTKFNIPVLFENILRKFKFYSYLTRITRALHEDQCTIFIISRSLLLRMRNVADKRCREYQNTHFMFSSVLFFENRARFEIMWKNIVEADRSQTIIWSMCTACWIPRATNTHSEYVILIAFPLQQWYEACALHCIALHCMLHT
jgi:hypothetical protein